MTTQELKIKVSKQELLIWKDNLKAINHTRRCVEEIFGHDLPSDYYPAVCELNSKNKQYLSSPAN